MSMSMHAHVAGHLLAYYYAIHDWSSIVDGIYNKLKDINRASFEIRYSVAWSSKSQLQREPEGCERVSRHRSGAASVIRIKRCKKIVIPKLASSQQLHHNKRTYIHADTNEPRAQVSHTAPMRSNF